MACSKCGVKQVYPVFKGYSSSSVEEDTALVQFRKTIQMVVDGVPTNYYASSVLHLTFSLIAQVLDQDPEVLHFHKKTEEMTFKLAYPRFN